LFSYLLGILDHLVLLPAHGNRLEKPKQRYRTHNKDTLLKSKLKQIRIMLKGGAQTSLTWNEHDDKVSSISKHFQIFSLS